jgi:hypothetical protein
MLFRRKELPPKTRVDLRDLSLRCGSRTFGATDANPLSISVIGCKADSIQCTKMSVHDPERTSVGFTEPHLLGSRPMGACLDAKPKSGLVLDGRQPPMASRAYRAGLATSCCTWIF